MSLCYTVDHFHFFFIKRTPLVCSAELPVVFLWWGTPLNPQEEPWLEVLSGRRFPGRTGSGQGPLLVPDEWFWWNLKEWTHFKWKKPERRGHWESMQEEGPGDGLTGKFYPSLESLLSARPLFWKPDGGKDPEKNTMKRVSSKVAWRNQKMDMYVYLPLHKECLPNIDLIERNAFSLWYWHVKLTTAMKVQIKQIKPICWLKDATTFQYLKNKIFTF